MEFYKYCGAGNDFVLLENFDGTIQPEDMPALARRLCDRHFGVGADGLMILQPPPPGAHCAMAFFNSDGSTAEMCGNGARCLCRHLHDRGFAGQEQRVQTTAGLVVGRCIDREHYRIRLNDPTRVLLGCTAAGLRCDYVELGSPGIPHAVLQADLSLPRKALRELARQVRHAPEFPRGANVNLWAPEGADALRLLTFERGVEDFTLACGTGTGATVFALARQGLVSGRDTRVTAEGGTLRVDVEEGLYLTGPAVQVFRGTWSL